MTLLDKLEKRLVFERLVIGLEEPVLVKGLGEIQAKIDSGNGGYNVIHGSDMYQEGDVLHFTTEDSQGNKKHLAKKVIDRIQVNIGGGNIQDRPVIELDIKFANTLYKKIAFSVTDRSDNDLKILISKSFVDDELDALIDVGEVNISKDNIQVDSVNESVLLEDGGEQISDIGTLKSKYENLLKQYNDNSGNLKDKIGRQIDGIFYNFIDEDNPDFKNLRKKWYNIRGDNNSQNTKEEKTTSYVNSKQTTQEQKDACKKQIEEAKQLIKSLDKKVYAFKCLLKQLPKKPTDKKQKATENEEVVLEGFFSKSKDYAENNKGQRVYDSTITQKPNNWDEAVNLVIDAWKNDEKNNPFKTKEDVEKNCDTKEKIQSYIDGLNKQKDELKTKLVALRGDIDDLTDKQSDEGFLSMLNRKLGEIANTSRQIRNGDYQGSLLALGGGFLKKFFNGGWMRNILKGALLASCVANPFLALPLMGVYSVQQARRKAAQKQISPKSVDDIKKNLNTFTKNISEKTVRLLGGMKKPDPKSDAEVIKDMMNADGVDVPQSVKESTESPMDIMDFSGSLNEGDDRADDSLIDDINTYNESVKAAAKEYNNSKNEEESEETVLGANEYEYIAEKFAKISQTLILEDGEIAQEQEDGEKQEDNKDEENDFLLEGDQADKYLKQLDELIVKIENRKNYAIYFLSDKGRDYVKEKVMPTAVKDLKKQYKQCIGRLDGNEALSVNIFESAVKQVIDDINNSDDNDCNGIFALVYNEDQNTRTAKIFGGYVKAQEKLSKQQEEKIDNIKKFIPSKEDFIKTFKKIQSGRTGDIEQEVPSKIQFKKLFGAPVINGTNIKWNDIPSEEQFK